VRYLEREDKSKIHEGIACFSGRLFDKSVDQGAVNIGINIRYERMRLNRSAFDTLYTRKIREVRNNLTGVDSILSIDTVGFATTGTGSINENRLVVDLGFYQDKVADRLDFGLTLHNIAGYFWKKETPDTIYRDTLLLQDSSGTDAIYTYEKRQYYSDQTSETDGWMDRRYRALTVGLLYYTKVMEDKMLLRLPFDLSMWRVFDKSRKTIFSFRTGVEAVLFENYALRFGYARAPRTVWEARPDLGANQDKLHLANSFTGGAGIRISTVNVDFYLETDGWGVGASYAF
jgi:hypothetical protein